MNLLHRADGFIAVDKPPGLNVIPGREGGEHAKGLLEARLGQRLWVVHRLDRDTSGVLLFALNADTHRTLSMAFEKGEVHKRYVAVAQGRLEAEQLIDQPIAEGRKGRMKVAEGGKPSRTRVRPLEALKNATLVEAEPLTGRTHQIRVHLSHVGHALVFDPRYQHGEQSAHIARTPLHAARLEWGGVVIESALPADIRALIEALR
ncbi:MAG: RNA pseudouridine synthase [Myxococcaceae bacterium]|nr:RNA pseudouridine synthase [Myxococcaceae bacterium]